MKKTLNLLYSLLLVTSFISHAADFDERPYEVIELINGKEVPKKYELLIKNMFFNESCIRPGHSFAQTLFALYKKCRNKQYDLPILYAEEGRRYELHPEENAPYACDMLDALCNYTPETYINPSPWVGSFESFEPENCWVGSRFYEKERGWVSTMKISFPFKDLKKD